MPSRAGSHNHNETKSIITGTSVIEELKHLAAAVLHTVIPCTEEEEEETDEVMAEEQQQQDVVMTEAPQVDLMKEQGDAPAPSVAQAATAHAQTNKDEADAVHEHIAQLEEAEAVDVPTAKTVSEEVKQLGPAPEDVVDEDLFDCVVKDTIDGDEAIETVEVYVCKHCHQEFPYPLRDLKRHRKACPAMAKGQEEDDEGMEQEEEAKPQDEAEEAEEEATTSSSVNENDYQVVTADDGKTVARCRYCDKTFHYNTRQLEHHADECAKRKAQAEEEATVNTQEEATKESIDKKRRPSKQDDAESTDEFTTPRRSKRLRTDSTTSYTGAPTATSTVSPTAKPTTKPEDEMSESEATDQFEAVVVGTRSHGKHRMRCKHCGSELMLRRGAAAKHLASCKAYTERQERNQELEDQVDRLQEGAKTTKPLTVGTNASRALILKATPTTSSDVVGEAVAWQQKTQDASVTVCASDQLTVCETLPMDQPTSLIWLFGSLEHANAMKACYRRTMTTVHAPIARFHALVRDLLCGLNLPKLLDSLPPTSAVSLLMNTTTRDVRHTCMVHLQSLAQAKTLFDAGASLSVEAPAAVRQAIVKPLAQDLGLRLLRPDQRHNAQIVMARTAMTLDWQFHPSERFVFQLSGKSMWRVRKGPIVQPIQSYQPVSKALNEAEEQVKVHVLMTGTPTALVPPSAYDSFPHETTKKKSDEDDEEEKQQASIMREVVLKPGAVMYLPAGTWYEAECMEDGVWLQVELMAANYGEVVADGFRQLLWNDVAGRNPMLFGDVKATRQHMDALLTTSKEKLASLTSADLLPECLVSDEYAMEMEEQQGEKKWTVDLTQHAFKSSRHLKILRTSTFRQNPLTVLFNVDNVPHIAPVPMEQTTMTPSPTTTKKALKKKQKKRSAVAIECRDKNYAVHVGFGNPRTKSMLHVHVRCNAFQAAVVEWIRQLDGQSFEWFEMADSFGAHGGKNLLVPRGQAHDEDEVKYVLRFLTCVGFVTQLKA